MDLTHQNVLKKKGTKFLLRLGAKEAQCCLPSSQDSQRNLNTILFVKTGGNKCLSK